MCRSSSAKYEIFVALVNGGGGVVSSVEVNSLKKTSDVAIRAVEMYNRKASHEIYKTAHLLCTILA